MSSDTVLSKAAWQLKYALGKERVSLADLRPSEFDIVLRDALRDVDLRELRGFKPLRDLLTRSPASFIFGARQDPTEHIQLTGNTLLGNASGLYDFKTHSAQVSRGVIDITITYRRYETDEETTDWHVANAWGVGRHYVRKSEQRILVLRRPNDHSYADENLFEVWYLVEKVPHEDRMVVRNVEVKHIPVARFRKHFGDRYPSIGRDLIWELSSLAAVTLRELESQATAFRTHAAKLERLGGAISE